MITYENIMDLPKKKKKRKYNGTQQTIKAVQ